jgi:hypothetical protein
LTTNEQKKTEVTDSMKAANNDKTDQEDSKPNIYGAKNIFGEHAAEITFHPMHIKTVIKSVLSIMAPKITQKELETKNVDSEQYRSAMFLGKKEYKEKKENKEKEKGEIFWAGSERRRAFSSTEESSKEEKFAQGFFSILSPEGEPGPDQTDEKVEGTKSRYWSHEAGWYRNMCWNRRSNCEITQEHGHLKNWALATTWQLLELGAKQTRAAKTTGKKTHVNLIDFEDYVSDIIKAMKKKIDVDSSDEESSSDEENEMEKRITDRYLRISGILARYPVARAYGIATTLSNFAQGRISSSLIRPWGNAKSDASKDWYIEIQDATDDLYRLRSEVYVDHMPTLLFNFVEPDKAVNFSVPEQREFNASK